MKIGDLVICKMVEGRPLGVIVKVRMRKVGHMHRIRVYDVFVNAHNLGGNIFPFQPHTVEAA